MPTHQYQPLPKDEIIIQMPSEEPCRIIPINLVPDELQKIIAGFCNPLEDLDLVKSTTYLYPNRDAKANLLREILGIKNIKKHTVSSLMELESVKRLLKKIIDDNQTAEEITTSLLSVVLLTCFDSSEHTDDEDVSLFNLSVVNQSVAIKSGLKMIQAIYQNYLHTEKIFIKSDDDFSLAPIRTFSMRLPFSNYFLSRIYPAAERVSLKNSSEISSNFLSELLGILNNTGYYNLHISLFWKLYILFIIACLVALPFSFTGSLEVFHFHLINNITAQNSTIFYCANSSSWNTTFINTSLIQKVCAGDCVDPITRVPVSVAHFGNLFFQLACSTRPSVISVLLIFFLMVTLPTLLLFYWMTDIFSEAIRNLKEGNIFGRATITHGEHRESTDKKTATLFAEVGLFKLEAICASERLILIADVDETLFPTQKLTEILNAVDVKIRDLKQDANFIANLREINTNPDPKEIDKLLKATVSHAVDFFASLERILAQPAVTVQHVMDSKILHHYYLKNNTQRCQKLKELGILFKRFSDQTGKISALFNAYRETFSLPCYAHGTANASQSLYTDRQ